MKALTYLMQLFTKTFEKKAAGSSLSEHFCDVIRIIINS